jgi:hypothetical protein
MLEELVRLKEEGLIGLTGFTSEDNNAAVFRFIEGGGFDAMQICYNLLHQHPHDPTRPFGGLIEARAPRHGRGDDAHCDLGDAAALAVDDESRRRVRPHAGADPVRAVQPTGGRGAGGDARRSRGGGQCAGCGAMSGDRSRSPRCMRGKCDLRG